MGCWAKLRSNLLYADDSHRAAVGTELLSCLLQGIHLCRGRVMCSNENHNLLTGASAMGNTFISFHVVSPNLFYRFLFKRSTHERISVHLLYIFDTDHSFQHGVITKSSVSYGSNTVVKNNLAKARLAWCYLSSGVVYLQFKRIICYLLNLKKFNLCQ